MFLGSSPLEETTDSRSGDADPGTWANVAPARVRGRLAAFRILDVRQPDEFHGELGHLPGAELVPLDRLEGRLQALEADEPVLVVCRSGARSSMACARLSAAGLSVVYNLAGGMLGWNAQGYGACTRAHAESAHRCSEREEAVT